MFSSSGAVLAEKIWGATPFHGERGSASLSRGSGGFAPSGGPGAEVPVGVRGRSPPEADDILTVKHAILA